VEQYYNGEELAIGTKNDHKIMKEQARQQMLS
jgi:hypothetical protein